MSCQSLNTTVAIIPKTDWGRWLGWFLSGYTGVYVVYHGILGHTIEIPKEMKNPTKRSVRCSRRGVDFLKQDPKTSLRCVSTSTCAVSIKTEDPKAENELVGPMWGNRGRVKMVVRNSRLIRYPRASTKTTMPKKPSI